MTTPPVAAIALVALLVLAQSATGQTFGSWTVDASGYARGSSDNVYAMTINDSEAGFGQFCYPASGSCLWILATKTGCKEDSRYPVLASASKGGAIALEVYCGGKFSDYFRYIFTDFDAVNELVKGGGRIGIVFPLASGEFRVTRFDLDGATTAISTMRSRAENHAQKANTGTRDTKL